MSEGILQLLTYRQKSKDRHSHRASSTTAAAQKWEGCAFQHVRQRCGLHWEAKIWEHKEKFSKV